LVRHQRAARRALVRAAGTTTRLPLTGLDEHEAKRLFPMLGMAICVTEPGEPSGTYHWETEQEDFLSKRTPSVL
jgi:hypothetical protein